MHITHYFCSRLVALIFGGLALLSQPVAAQVSEAWPTKPVRFVVPYVAGGASDITVRSIAQLLTTSLGQTMMVENKAGGGGNIGTDFVAKAAPDGYTFLMAYAGPIAINPHLYKNLAQLVRQFTYAYYPSNHLSSKLKPVQLQGLVL